jgi:cystathionine gamma-synthase
MVRKPFKPESMLVHAGRPEGPGAPMNTPIVPASNFILGDGKIYSRENGVPTWQALEDILGALEQGQALAFASGMAAVSAVFDLLPAGAKVALPDDCYQGVAALALEGEAQGRWQIERLATDDTAGWVQAAMSVDLLWVESPSNPMLVLADLAAIAAAPRRSGTLLVVDNTFATPLNQQPLVLGADVSLHSATKFIGGHSDLLGGLLAAADPALFERLRRIRQRHGATPGTLECYLATRGLRTLALRLERSQHNALAIAEFLEGHRSVASVRYPGLPSHPQHQLAREQLGGFGAIITLVLHGDGAAAERVCQATQLVRNATSLGSVETTMERRAAYAGQEHLPASLLRISVGVEALEDLLEDLDLALAQA